MRGVSEVQNRLYTPPTVVLPFRQWLLGKNESTKKEPMNSHRLLTAAVAIFIVTCNGFGAEAATPLPPRQTLEKNLELWRAEAAQCQQQMQALDAQTSRQSSSPLMPPAPASANRLRTSSLQPGRLPGTGSLPDANGPTAFAPQRKALQARIVDAEQHIRRLESALGIHAGGNALVPSEASEPSGPKVMTTPEVAAEARFSALPAMKDEFVEPKLAAHEPEPSYVDTIEFINSRLSPDEKIGFGKDAGKIILRHPQLVRVFDPKDLSPNVKYVEEGGYYNVFLNGRNGAEAFSCQTPGQPQPAKSSWISIEANDRIEAEKLAKAFSHLILMFGGKKEAF